MTAFEMLTLGLQGFVLIGVLLILILPFLILCDVLHAVEDIKASLALIRDGKFPTYLEAEESLSPVKKGDLKFHIPSSFKPPFEL